MFSLIRAVWQLAKKRGFFSQWLDYVLIYGGAALVLWYFAPSQHDTKRFAFTPALAPMAEHERITCVKLAVYDGDTIAAKCGQHLLRVRLNGIDAPESNQIPYGSIAQSALAARLPPSFELHSAGADIYGRTLGTLYAGAINLNEWLVRQGFAVAYDDKSTPVLYRRAEARAQSEQRGVWQIKGLHQNPKAWRKYDDPKAL